MKLLRTEECAVGTTAFYFERPDDFTFTPGQFVEVALEKESPDDAYRSFSIASAPSEPHLMIATRSRDSGFKKALRSLPAGSDVEIDGPYGELTLQAEPGAHHVLIAGGIGITPFRSILVEAASDGFDGALHLFYVNREAGGCAFFDELVELTHRAPDMAFVPTLTAPSDGWSGERGRLDSKMLMRHLESPEARYYVSGPPGMVDATRKMLAAMGVAEEHIRSESFDGY